jgi:hypothetical protein
MVQEHVNILNKFCFQLLPTILNGKLFTIDLMPQISDKFRNYLIEEKRFGGGKKTQELVEAFNQILLEYGMINF